LPDDSAGLTVDGNSAQNAVGSINVGLPEQN
jgi:hypothetical protein